MNIDYKESGIVTISLERYEGLLKQIKELEEEVMVLESPFSIKAKDGKRIVEINANRLFEMLKGGFEYRFFSSRVPVADVVYVI